jgi:hypothetical protein
VEGKNMDYAKNVKYFKKPNYQFPIACIFAGACCFFGAVLADADAALYLIAIALMALGILIIVNSGKGRPTDAEMDAQVALPLETILEKAYNKHGISEDRVNVIPLIVHGGYVNTDEKVEAIEGGSVKSFIDSVGNLINTTLKEDILDMKGKDGLERKSMTEWIVLLFSKTEMFSYQLRTSLISPLQDEHAEEIPYRDISAVSVDSTSSGFRFLKLVMTGQKPKVYAVDDNAETNASINALRNKVREIRE